LAFWQTEEENQMAVGSPRAALGLPPHIARLCGWCKPGEIMNKQYSGGPRADPLGAEAWLNGRPLDWGGRVWQLADRDATPEPVSGATTDTWSGPQEFSGDIAWESYPSCFGEMALPVSSTGALTSIEWPGSAASREQIVATIEQCLGVMEREGAVILAHAVADDTMDAYVLSPGNLCVIQTLRFAPVLGLVMAYLLRGVGT
jgi:hypothetical protein